MVGGSSSESLKEATRSRAKFSGHGKALGAAGYKHKSDHPENCEFLSEPGQTIAISPKRVKAGHVDEVLQPEEIAKQEAVFEEILIGVAWDNIRLQRANIFAKIYKTLFQKGVDLDLGCLYELKDGTRGALQAFGDKYGDLDKPPYMRLSGDERTGNKEGNDEYILVKGKHWEKIKRILVYIYIYEGAPSWSDINPQIIVDVPGENDLHVTLSAHNDALALCAVGGLENVRGGIKLTNYTEYFPGHAEMDRAFGFGLKWGEGEK